MSYPRVLIFGQAFNTYSGGGITISNLFKGWPVEKIAVATSGVQLINVSSGICNTYYQLGREEVMWIFPFNFFLPSYTSDPKSFNSNTKSKNAQNTPGIKNLLISNIFAPFFRWCGLYLYTSRIFLSDKLKNWLSVFKPEVLYIQVSSRDGILLAKELCAYLKIPSAIHMMDDWPATISNKGLFKHFWNRKIDAEFRQLLNMVDLHLSISDAMTTEYLVRYNKNFIPFHNPVETESWIHNCKYNFEINDRNVSVLHAGRIGTGITDSLNEIAAAIDEMNSKGYNIKLYIQAPAANFRVLKLLRSHKCIIINPVAEYDQIPKIFSSADILLLANDFSVRGIAFLKFSMPTKATEYMISGTPIFVYAPAESAVSKLFLQNECGLCISEHNKYAIIKGLKYLINNEAYRKKISENAVKLAKEIFDAKKVRKEFQQLLLIISKKEKEFQS
jgi:glycosyltransferase involved in cell wall biosynthesis